MGSRESRSERQFEIDVQEFVRDAISWLEARDGVDREVLVLDDSGEIIGIAMHEDDDGDRFIEARAIRSGRHREDAARDHNRFLPRRVTATTFTAAARI